MQEKRTDPFCVPRCIVAAIAAFAALACAAEQPLHPPEVGLTVPPPFSSDVSVKRYRVGEDILKSPPYSLIPTAPMTEYHGWFGPRAARPGDIHGWTVRVYATFSKKVAAACAASSKRLEADLEKGPDLLKGEESPYMVARIRRKRFRWGNAVSFLSQGSQDALYAPENGRLSYEVWGVTADQRYTVTATVSVGHPKLPDWDDSARSRVFHSVEALKRGRDYKRIEKCKPEEFKPSLTAFDEMLDSLTIR